jgi:hypothetical protein
MKYLTYEDLLQHLLTLTPAELALDVALYLGDVDVVCTLVNIQRNTDDDMGEAICSLQQDQPVLIVA